MSKRGEPEVEDIEEPEVEDAEIEEVEVEGEPEEIEDVEKDAIEAEIEDAKKQIAEIDGAPEEPEEKVPETPEAPEEPEIGDVDEKYLDQLNLMAGETGLVEAVWQVGHYNFEYKSETSVADVAFEITETDPAIHEEVMAAYVAGTDVAVELLKQAESEGLVEQGEGGGYNITDAGKKFVEENKDKLGNTYESKKHGGAMEDSKQK